VSHPVQEEDRIAVGKIVIVAIVSLAIFGVGVVWAVSIQRDQMGSIVSKSNAAPAAMAGAPEVGIVYQWPFVLSQYANEKAAATKGRLERYGWVDKNAKVVHIPIDQAIDKWVSQAGGKK
jgi:hypothetical protein